MAKAVFTTKRSPTYDDLVEERYHFPRTYLRQVEQTIGDWIVYYEPRRTTGDQTSSGGLSAYFATARVVRVVPDAARTDLFYAHVADYLEFDRPVRFQRDGAYPESALQKRDGSTNKGAFGRSVRILPDSEYEAIVTAGFSALLAQRSLDGSGAVREDRWGWTAKDPESDRPRIACVGERWFRDRAFTARVREVYRNRCAFTGLQIVNGGGRPEVQAAHIRPVHDSGPDSVRNGIALSHTVHWMFDRGLISMDDDGWILVALSGVPTEFRRLLRADLRAELPLDPSVRPHPAFLRYHRERFKG
jgi:putative restriction endonuclease